MVGIVHQGVQLRKVLDELVSKWLYCVWFDGWLSGGEVGGVGKDWTEVWRSFVVCLMAQYLPCRLCAKCWKGHGVERFVLCFICMGGFGVVVTRWNYNPAVIRKRNWWNEHEYGESYLEGLEFSWERLDKNWFHWMKNSCGNICELSFGWMED